jgi:hypothetical protein
VLLMSRSLDELIIATEHAEPMHPMRALIKHRFYLDGLVSTEGGLWLLMMDGPLLVPLIFAAFFYPIQVLAIVAVLLVVSFIGYEGYVLWRRRHLLRTTTPSEVA